MCFESVKNKIVSIAQLPTNMRFGLKPPAFDLGAFDEAMYLTHR